MCIGELVGECQQWGLLAELYAPPFAAAADAGVAGYMVGGARTSVGCSA